MAGTGIRIRLFLIRAVTHIHFQIGLRANMRQKPGNSPALPVESGPGPTARGEVRASLLSLRRPLPPLHRQWTAPKYGCDTSSNGEEEKSLQRRFSALSADTGFRTCRGCSP